MTSHRSTAIIVKSRHAAEILVQTPLESITANLITARPSPSDIPIEAGQRSYLIQSCDGGLVVTVTCGGASLDFDVNSDDLHAAPPEVRVDMPDHGSRADEILTAIKSSDPCTVELCKHVGLADGSLKYIRPLKPDFWWAGEISPRGTAFGHLFQCEAGRDSSSWVVEHSKEQYDSYAGGFVTGSTDRLFFWCPTYLLPRVCSQRGRGSLAGYFAGQIDE